MEGVPAAVDYAGGFGVDLMLKDLGLANDAARKAGVRRASRAVHVLIQSRHSDNTAA